MVQTQTMNNKSIVDPAAANKVFISYSWENPDVRTAVHELATRLEKDGVKALLDEKDLHPGQDLNHFMLSMVRDKTITKILLICDKTYKAKADERKDGVGKEAGIIQGDVLEDPMQTRVIPISWDGDFEHSLPNFCKDRYGLLFPRGDDFETDYRKLLDAILDKHPTAPAVQTVSLSLADPTAREAENDALNTEKPVFRTNRERVSDFFHHRFCRAFPDVDVCPEYREKMEIRTRLGVLFKTPVESDNIWWLSSEGTGEFNFFDFDPYSNREYFGDEQAGWFSCCDITRVVPICYGMADWTANVYVESAPTSASPQPFSRTNFSREIRFFHKSGRELSGSERNSGCFFEGPVIHEFSNSDLIEVTERLQPFNFLICPKFGPVIQGRNDDKIIEIMNGILEQKQTTDDLREFLLRLPKPSFKYEKNQVHHVFGKKREWAQPGVLSRWLSNRNTSSTR